MNPHLENLISYIAANNPKGVNRMAYNYGYLPPHTEEGRMGFMFQGVIEEGDKFIRDMALIHPDRDLIISASEKQIALNADGSSVEPNVINIKSETTAPATPKEDGAAPIIRVVFLIVAAYMIVQAFK